MDKSLSWHEPVPFFSLRRLVALVLRRSVRALAAWSRRVAPPAAPAASDPVLEFYAEAGAPEGALFINGQRVGVLPGVTRL